MEEAVRRQVCELFFEGDWAAFDGVLRMGWQERQDDEVCAIIKSLQDAAQQRCFEEAPNDIEQNVTIARELEHIVRCQAGDEIRNNALSELERVKEHLEYVEREHVQSGGQYVVDTQTVMHPRWKRYYKEKGIADIDVEAACAAVCDVPVVTDKLDR